MPPVYSTSGPRMFGAVYFGCVPAGISRFFASMAPPVSRRALRCAQRVEILPIIGRYGLCRYQKRKIRTTWTLRGVV